MQGEVQQVRGAGELHPAQADEVSRQQRRNGSERERPDDAVLQRVALIFLGQPEHEHREDHGVVSAQQPLVRDEQADGDEVGGLDVLKEREIRHAPSVYRA